jgi:hypothetical protein
MDFLPGEQERKAKSILTKAVKTNGQSKIKAEPEDGISIRL